MPEVRPATREEGGGEIENGERESEGELHDSSLLDELFNMVVEVDNCNQQQDAPRVTPSSASTSTAQMSGANKALSSHMFYPHKGSDAVFGRRKLVERFPCAVTSEKWRQMYNEKDDAKKMNEQAKQARKEEREKQKLKRRSQSSENSEREKRKEEKRQRQQTTVKRHKRKATNDIGNCVPKIGRRNPCTECEGSVGATGPRKSGLQCSRCRDKIHVSCIEKAHLLYFAGYDDSDDEDFDYHCTRCFKLDENSSSASDADE